MRSNKFKVLRSVLGLSLSLLMFGGASTAVAEVIKVDRENPVITAENNLVIEKNMSKKPTVKVSTNNSGATVKYFDDPKLSEPHHTFQDGYGANRVVFSNMPDTFKITVNYDYVGKYKGKNISAVAEYSNLKVHGNEQFFVISDNLYSGHWYHNIYQFDYSLKFFEENGNPVLLSGDSFLSVNSLNGSGLLDPAENTANEFVSYLNQDQNMKTYITDDSNVIEMENPFSSGKVFAGGNGNFTDVLGSKTFKRNTVSFQVNGSEMKFRVGSLKKSPDVWNSFSCATLFNTEQKTPVKKVVDDSGKDMDKKVVKAGDVLTYQIEQKVHTLGVDLLERYSTFEIKDQLPEKVVFEKAWLKEDEQGEVTFDEDKNEVLYAASSEFLKSMKLDGETYVLNVQVKVSEDVRASDLLVNTASVTVNSTEKETNEVENKGSDPQGSFRIFKVTDQITGLDPDTQLPIFEEKPQSGVSYKITANEDIKLSDGTEIHEAGEDLGEISTNEKGVAEKEDVYAGQYKAVEFKAPLGIQVDPTPILIDVVAEKDTATGEGNQKDPLQEVRVNVHKIFELENGDFFSGDSLDDLSKFLRDKGYSDDVVTGVIGNVEQDKKYSAVFGLYHGANFNIDNENTILKDTLVSTLETEKGVASYQGVLLPEQTYYIKEISTSEGYQINENKFTFIYVPISNEAVHEINIYEDGYVDAGIKKEYGENQEAGEEITKDFSPIKNMMIRKNSIVKSILKEDGTRVDHYDLLKDGEKVVFEGMVYIGDNDSIESIKLLDKLPDGFTLEAMRLYDETGNDITKNTTYEVDGQSASLIVNKEYATKLKRTSLRWVLDTTYHYKEEHVGNKLENQITLKVNNDDILSNIVTLSPPVIEKEKEVVKPTGSLPQTGEEIQRYATLIGAVIFLGVIAFWYTRKGQQTDENKNE
ncbi:SpaA isopeptide-forming pilin-related protein [Enterococcus sp. LJL128]